MSPDALFDTVQLGSLSLPNRVAMAPMTRARAGTNGVPTSSMATYYAQRASAGLIVTEAINISADAVGSGGTPGIWTEAQIEGWRTVTNAVHAEGGHIVAQLWHTGRVGHSVERGGALPVAPSALRIEGQQHHTSQGRMDYEVPRALATHEVEAIVDDYGRAASAALEAGFDAVELHAAFGYLPNQFLVDGANHRTDRYGGSVENRVRFVVDAMQAMIDAVGPDRVGIKLSPTIPFNGMVDTDPIALYGHLIERLNPMGLLYVHLMEGTFPLDDHPDWPRDNLAAFGSRIAAPVIANGGFDGNSASAAVRRRGATMVSFGQAFIANPDLPRRLWEGVPLSEADPAASYGSGDAGYIDYPFYTDPDATRRPALAA